MATAFGQLETHSILDRDQIIDLYNSIDGYEDTVAGFWDQRYALTFPANHGWQLYRQKFVYHDVARNPKLKHDALMRRWGGLDTRWFKVVMREDKKDSQSPKQLEQQASNYARIVVEEFPLEGILIQTTIGDTFRTWWFGSKKSDMEPLFGQEKYSKRSYIKINSLEGSSHWNSFVDKVNASPLLGRATTLKSQGGGEEYRFDRRAASSVLVAGDGEPSSTTAAYNQNQLAAATVQHQNILAPVGSSYPNPAMSFPSINPSYSVPGPISYTPMNDPGLFAPMAGQSSDPISTVPYDHAESSTAATSHMVDDSAMDVDEEETAESVDGRQYTPVKVIGFDHKQVRIIILEGKTKGKVFDIQRSSWRMVTIIGKDGARKDGYIAETSKNKYRTFDALDSGKGKGKAKR